MNTSTQSPVRITPASIADLEAQLAASPSGVYAVVDACDEPAVPERAKQLKKDAVILYYGAAARDYWAIAPYLLRVDSEQLAWMHENLWKSPWGFLLVSNADLETLRRHFRRFLKVKDADGETMFFRFYDPRVLSKMLLTSTPAEAEAFFGPIQKFFIVNEKEEVLTLELRS